MKKIALALLIVMAAGLHAGYAEERAGAAPSLRIGIGVVCDTEGQIERYASLMGDTDPKAAIQKVNDEAHNPLACGAVAVAYKINRDIGNVRNEKGFFRIVEITVVAASSHNGWQMIMPAAKQYIAVQETEA